LAILVLAILGALWAALLIPPILKNRSGSRSMGSIGDIAARVTSLRKAGGVRSGAGFSPGAVRTGVVTPIGAPVHQVRAAVHPEVARRRRDVLMVLATASVGTLFLALITGMTVVWAVFLLAAAALAGYLALLRHFVRVQSIPVIASTRFAAPGMAQTRGMNAGRVPQGARRRVNRPVPVRAPVLTNVRFLTAPVPAPQFALRQSASS
jgi:hypothetical protein